MERNILSTYTKYWKPKVSNMAFFSRYAGKMKKVFVVIMSFALGILVIITRYFQKRSGSLYDVHARESWVTIILLLLTWGTPFYILFGQGRNKKKK